MKRILITGGTSGIGLATARLLSNDGHKLLLTGRRTKRLEKIQQELGENCFISELDVQNSQAISDLFANLPQEMKPLDVVINNAGLALGISPVPDVNIVDWDTMIETNITGFTHVAQEAIKTMKPNISGQLINIASCAGIAPYKGGNVYSATKAYVRMLSRNFRTDLLGSNIRVNIISPGAVETEYALVRFKGDQAKADKVYEGYRQLTPEDIADGIKFVIDAPEHVNIEEMQIMPTDQAYAGFNTSANL